MRTLLLLGLLAVAGSLPATSMPRTNLRLTGSVVDEATGLGLEYATVSVYDLDTLLVEGAVTDGEGHFTLNVPAGRYLLRVKFLGYARRDSSVTVAGATHLEPIALAAADVNLDAVEVTAARTRMQLSLDKKTFEVGEDLLSRGTSANHVLDQLPSVSVSPEGAVSLRGNAGVKVLINGRPSALADNNALESIPAESIERVEIVTNPSARYESAGTAGIINIILKQERQRGHGGSLNLTTGYPADHRLNGNVNLRREKFTAFLTAGGRYSNYAGRERLFRESILDGTTFRLDRTGVQARNDVAASAYAGIDYQLADRTTLSGSYSYYWMINDDETNTDFRYEGSLPDRRQVIDYYEPGQYHQLDVSLQHDLGEGEKLTAYLKNDLWAEDETERSTFRTAGNTVLDYESGSGESSRDHLLQIDYERSTPDGGKWEAGLRGETRVIVADYTARDLLDEAVLTGFDNRLDYFERIGSAYLQYSHEGEKFGYQLGLRDEFTLVRTRNRSPEYPDLRKPYNRLFPTANVSYTFSEGWRSQLSYSKRIYRPGFFQLNPFMSLSDPNGLFIGNPDLDPVYTDRVEINVVAQSEKLTLNPAIYASRSNDFIQYVVEYRAENVFGLADGTIVDRPVNLDHEDRLGLELTANYRPAEFLNLTLEWNYFGYRQRGTFAGRNLDFEHRSWSAGGRASVDLPADWRLQASLRYQAPFETAQQTSLAVVNATFGLSKEWAGKYTLSLSARAPQYNRFETRLPDLRADGERYWNDWRFGGSISYRFERGAESRERSSRGSIR